MPSTLTREEREKLVELAESGNLAAVRFLQETALFRERGGRYSTSLRILKESGDVDAGAKWDNRRRQTASAMRAMRARRKAKETSAHLRQAEDQESSENEHSVSELVSQDDTHQNQEKQKQDTVAVKDSNNVTHLIAPTTARDEESSATSHHNNGHRPAFNGNSADFTAVSGSEDLRGPLAEINEGKDMRKSSPPPARNQQKDSENDDIMINIDGDNTMESAARPKELNLKALEYEWRKTSADAGSRKEDSEVQKISLEAKLRAGNASFDPMKTDSKTTPLHARQPITMGHMPYSG